MRAMAASFPDDAAVYNVVAYIATLPSQQLESKELCGWQRRTLDVPSRARVSAGRSP